MLDHDNLGDFQDAVDYDIRDSSDTGVDFYSQLALETGGPVLEIGCGTGRASIPIARMGIPVTGLDAVPGMLAQARSKSEGLPVRWVKGDARSFALDQRFRLIYMTGNVFQFFLTRRDQESVLTCARLHLEKGGYLAFETRNPRSVVLGRAPAQRSAAGFFPYLETYDAERYLTTYTDAAGNEVRVWLTQTYDPATQILSCTTHRRWLEASGEITRVTRTSLRFTFPQELDALLSENGFGIVRRYGDWNLEPLRADSPSIIIVCHAKSLR